MNKWFGVGTAMIVLCSLAFLGCKDEPVGAPCFPETDKGTPKYQTGTVWSIETRSVQCQTRMCISRTEEKMDGDVILEDQSSKFSFCSCKCDNLEGRSDTKKEDLCECPGKTSCEEVNFPINDTPGKVLGQYCIPNCIIEGCQDENGAPDLTKECQPSKDSDKPWAWKCRTRSE